jgi:3-isopropylmalate/(R)-2-methylmalate dehydratase small subunit
VKPLTVHQGRVVPLLRRDIDTDQIIPKQFLKSIDRTGFGRYLFHDWRAASDGSADSQFVLDQPRYQGASILVAGANFGCGSSREHAAWALDDWGIRVIIAQSFADIFRNNAVTNGLLPIALPQRSVQSLARLAEQLDGYTLDVNLLTCRICDGRDVDIAFDIYAPARRRLLHGLDDIGVILQHEAAIDLYEARHGLARLFGSHERLAPRSGDASN